MADIRPFLAYRPAKGLEEQVAALPYDVYSSEEARKEVARHPLSFLAIDRAETQLEETADPHGEEVYKKAAALLADRVRDGVFIRDEVPSYYIYELEMQGRRQTGIVGCARVEDYLQGVIRKHENTRQDKEEDRVRHIEACAAQTGPIFLAYRARARIHEIIARYREGKPVCDFATPDGVVHRVWVISEEADIVCLREEFALVPAVYIADGHHRCASAVRVALARRFGEAGGLDEEACEGILSVLFPDEELLIMAYDRVVKDLGGLTEQEFLNRVGQSFLVETMDEAFRPEKRGTFGMYLSGKWYRLSRREGIPLEGLSVVEALDVSILQRNLLDPILGIQDPKTDQRIDFVGGIRGLGELERRCHEDCVVAFSLYPTSIEELFEVADAGLLMPPKSTWFEPKLRSGLFLHSLLQPDGFYG